MTRLSLSHLRIVLGLLTGVMLWLLWQASTVTTPEMEAIKLRYLVCDALFGGSAQPPSNSVIGAEYVVVDNWRGLFPLALLYGVIFSITRPLARFILLIVAVLLGAATGIYFFHFCKYIVPLGGPALLLGCSYLCGTLIHLETERIERNKNLALDLLNHSETERQRIAKDLHDETLPALSRTLRLVDALQKKLEGDPLPAEIRSNIESTLAEMRRTINDLHPAVLEELGLRTAIQMLVDRANQSQVKAKLNAAELPSNLPRDYQLCIYRILQEALTNVERHAKATEVEVSLRMKDKHLLVHVIDNGVGGVHRKVGSLGLQNISDRASAVGGTAQWTAPDSKTSGTKLEVSIPIPKQASSEQAKRSLLDTQPG